jgi:hypothetical protein
MAFFLPFSCISPKNIVPLHSKGQSMLLTNMINRKSIRFYNDHKVRAIWSEEENKWYFSATDIIGAINDEQDYVKAGNYWRWLKKKLASLGVQPVSALTTSNV